MHEIDLQFWTPYSEATGNKAITWVFTDGHFVAQVQFWVDRCPQPPKCHCPDKEWLLLRQRWPSRWSRANGWINSRFWVPAPCSHASRVQQGEILGRLRRELHCKSRYCLGAFCCYKEESSLRNSLAHESTFYIMKLFLVLHIMEQEELSSDMMDCFM